MGYMTLNDQDMLPRFISDDSKSSYWMCSAYETQLLFVP